MRDGSWVYLANCHLSISWLSTLEKLVEKLGKLPRMGEEKVEEKKEPVMVAGRFMGRGHEKEKEKVKEFLHPNFRLWLSSDPDPRFPISLIQNSIKMTTEPPSGIKANMARLYDNLNPEQFERCKKPEKYKKLLYSLTFFHSVLVERRKFLTLGWNVNYDFNDSDFSVCENLLSLYLDEYEQTPWEALKYLIAQANYGGRVTDSLDRRLLIVYINQFFNDDVLNTPNFPLSGLDLFRVPDDGPLESYQRHIAAMPVAGSDPAEAFGQNANADIASQMQETNLLLDTLLSLQPKIVAKGVASREDEVLELLVSLIEQIPQEMDLKTITRRLIHDSSPLKTVLLQEIDRYNHLLSVVKKSLLDLQKGLKGLVVISPEIEQVFEALFAGKVPSLWQQAYPSMKPLGMWVRDLIDRIDQLRSWASQGPPKVFWLSGFTFPTGFLTALMQATARRNSIPIDNLMWEFIIAGSDEAAIGGAPKDGAYIKGLFLEGGRWDVNDQSLCDPLPMELSCRMPIIHFKPVEMKKKSGKGIYSCPLYMYPLRGGTSQRPSFLMMVDLKSGARDAEYWIKRGTALLLSMAE